MILAHHLVWTAYGHWLPNDPRGSMSRTIASDVIAELGDLHYGRKRLKPAAQDLRVFYANAAEVLKFPLLTFASPEVDAIASAFARVIRDEQYTCYACAIMPDHIHILIRKHKHYAERMVDCLQRASKEAVIEARVRHFDHPVWASGGWKVFLDSVEDIDRTVSYVDENPVKAMMPRQQWKFVTPYDGWPARRGKNSASDC